MMLSRSVFCASIMVPNKEVRRGRDRKLESRLQKETGAPGLVNEDICTRPQASHATGG
jgi:hypothetical protein